MDRGEEAQSFEREEEDSLESYPNKRRSSVKAEVKVPIVGKTDTSQKGTKKVIQDVYMFLNHSTFKSTFALGFYCFVCEYVAVVPSVVLISIFIFYSRKF